MRSEGGSPPFVWAADRPGAAAETFAAEHRDEIDRRLEEHGALLLRGFRTDGAAGLAGFIESLGSPPIEYRDRAAPRTSVHGHIYTATDYPPEHRIFLHNESSFAHRFPQRIFFFCEQPSRKGGETPLADVRRVLKRLDPADVDGFDERGVLYVRNFRKSPFGLSWQEAFQTSDREALERDCAREGIETEWVDPEWLRTRQVRPAVARHPGTGEALWFNHAAVLHVSTLPEARRKILLKLCREEALPSQTYYGDGSPIAPETLARVRDAYLAESVRFDWQAGDLLLVDNLLMAHGREPFSGPRRVLVGMARPLTWTSLLADAA